MATNLLDGEYPRQFIVLIIGDGIHPIFEVFMIRAITKQLKSREGLQEGVLEVGHEVLITKKKDLDAVKRSASQSMWYRTC